MDREVLTKEVCFHCGDKCETLDYSAATHFFCCHGCLSVYEILNSGELCDYYQFNSQSGNKVKRTAFNEYEVFENPEIVDRILKFKSDTAHHVTLKIPGIHCSSCVYLLENLSRLDSGVLKSEISFLKKELVLVYNPQKTSLKNICELLAKIGYAPLVNNDEQKSSVYKKILTTHYIKLSIAGFAFGNVMMFSFPEYLGGGFEHSPYKFLFPFINMALSIPVFFYSATDYYKSAWNSIRQKQLNLDVPVSLGIFALFLRSILDIFISNQMGFFDSFCGFVFFLLIGKTFQMKFYDHLNFERNYRSYYPLAVLKQFLNVFKSELVDKLEEGDVIRIRHQEIIPCDSTLISNEAEIDYSFVTGENTPVRLHFGEKVYAGGRVAGLSSDFRVKKNAEKSYLNQLWSKSYEKVGDSKSVTRFADQVGRYFTYGIMLLCAVTFLYHLSLGWMEALSRLSAVAIVACPCALALSAPFVFGTASGILAKAGLYFKDAFSLERFSRSQILVFDKTGTLTSTKESKVFSSFASHEFDEELKAIFQNSLHPLSRLISESLQLETNLQPDSYEEIKGSGIVSEFKNKKFTIGSANFLNEAGIYVPVHMQKNSGSVFVAVNSEFIGRFDIRFAYRQGLEGMFTEINKNYDTYLLSGDKDFERPLLVYYISNPDHLHFNLSPSDKLDIVADLNKKSICVMIGDGLNDAAALQSASVGISVVEDQSQFTPSCDAILAAEKMTEFNKYAQFAKSLQYIIIITFGVSIAYNSIGLFFAVQGKLTPLLSAILMPLSSITVISIAIGLTTIFAWRKKVL